MSRTYRIGSNRDLSYVPFITGADLRRAAKRQALAEARKAAKARRQAAQRDR